MGSGGWRLEALESGGQSADGGFRAIVGNGMIICIVVMR